MAIFRRKNKHCSEQSLKIVFGLFCIGQCSNHHKRVYGEVDDKTERVENEGNKEFY